jgi:hypothetical protein
MRGKGTKLGEGKGTKLSEGCPKVRLSQDRMTILSFHLAYSEGKGTKLGEGERDFRDYYANPDSGRLRSGLFHLGIVHGAVLNFWKPKK